MSQQRGRLTRAQRRALDELGHKYDFKTQPFEQTAPLGVEIGFGMGEALANWAQGCPEWNLLGIEIYPSGLGAMLNRIEQEGLTNVRLTSDRAEEVLAENLGEASVQEFRILFPDPWPKKRHHKRRLLQPGFLKLLASRLKPGGELYVATDWAPYAEWALEALSQEPTLENLAQEYAERDERRVETKFEARGRRLGHDIFDLRFTRRAET